jgi:MoaA/NifB/PqqE/SkfB family radical SAM enzyme
MLRCEEEIGVTKYGFGGRLSAVFPSQVIVDVTEVCNLACIHCPHREYVTTKEYGARFLDPALNEKMVREVSEAGKGITQYIRYTSNGEPLLHKHIIEMLSYAVKHSGTTVSLTTNGTLLTPPMAMNLLEIGVDVIDISIDAYKPETYAMIRRGGDLAVTEDNVLNLLKLRETFLKKTKVVVSYVEQDANAAETADFKKYWEDKGADYVVIRRLHSFAGARREIAERLRHNPAARRPCLYPWERITLNARGFLGFCPSGWTQANELEDYRHTSIAEIWRGMRYDRLRDEHLEGMFSEYLLCNQCADWQQVRWPSEGRSYADMIEGFKES